MSETAKHSLLTAREHEPFPCGYAPRALHLSLTARAVFVGSKDGSIQAVVTAGSGYASFPLLRAGGSGVRALSEWQDGWLWIGRRGGEVELIDVRKLRQRGAFKVHSLNEYLPDGASVRALGWVDAKRRFVSFQEDGTWIVPHEVIGPGSPQAALRRAFRPPRRCVLQEGGTPLCEILFVLPFEGKGGRYYLMANTRGEIFAWDGSAEGRAKRIQPWPSGEEPGLVNDFTVLWSRRTPGRDRAAVGVFLATDRGVHLLQALTDSEGSIRCLRLALPGLGALCMAITYAEPQGHETCYLWAADSRGDGHLYWATKVQSPASIRFLPSGLFHAGSQSMLVTSWSRRSALVVCQARRNDQLVVTEYRKVIESDPDHDLEKIRQLLSQGDARAIARFWKGRKQEPWVTVGGRSGGWPPYAQLSELFELLAESAKGLEKLLEFLGDPSAEAAWRILQGLLDGPGSVAELRRAIELWTLSLLGILNRAGGKLEASQRDSGYLGIIRWQRDLRQRIESDLRLDLRIRPPLLREIDTSISMVRKWGLFGEANAQRENLLSPLVSLATKDQALDRLTYKVLLFERGVSLQAWDRRRSVPGRNAWDLSIRSIQGRSYFAVSWHWGWVELYGLVPEGVEPRLVLQAAIAPLSEEWELSDTFRPISAEEIAEQDVEIPKPQYRHSRAVLLGAFDHKDQSRPFLLTAPSRRGKADESLHLWGLRSSGGRLEVAGLRPVELPLSAEGRQSVYSLLDLGSGWVLAGLSGHGGTAMCLWARIEVKAKGSLGFGQRHLFRDDSEKGSEPAHSASLSRNRVWSLAQVGSGAAGAPHDLLVGCEDGSIRRLRIRHGDGEPRGDWTRVAKMSSAVKALACRQVKTAHGALLRIFAGGANGSIVAWQELPNDSRNPTSEERYASLWAAHEGEELAGLHLVQLPDADREASRMVLGVTRDERFVFFNDRDGVADLSFGVRPKRIPLPGCRHGTLQRSRQQRASAFATCLVPGAADLGFRDTGQVAALLTASKHGVVRLLSLHDPHFTPQRKARFTEILEDWWRIVQGNHQLRLVHAAYRSAPSLELILVRWLLDKAWPATALPPPREGLPAWMLPRNLRYLLALRRFWLASLEAVTDRERGRTLGSVYESLLAALREAFRLDDLLLYQEICEVALQRGNWDLFEQALRADGPRGKAAADLYLRVFEAIEESLQQWRGGAHQEESLARMNVARNMVDGDTAFCLSLAADKNEAFRVVLGRRIGGVRDLILKGDDRATQEALRAANLSLLRLCKRLVKVRTCDPKAQLPWEGVFEPYFQELTAAAARAFRSPLQLNDVLRHGYARTFALAVCACPAAALRIATRLTETHLISNPDSADDLSWLIPLQFGILKQIGIEVPDLAQNLFRLGAHPPQQGLDPLLDPWLLDKKMGRGDGSPVDPPEALWAELGSENARDLSCLWRLYGLVNWFTRLERMLSYRPDAMTRAAWHELEELMERLRQPDVQDFYGHSLDFWSVAVTRFSRMSHLFHEVEGSPIEPRTVLFSRGIAAWATEALEDLERRHQESAIFQPEHAVFREVLDRLRRAAVRFPDSAAVRMNVVRGVLGHHLLEDLDEHLFELQEIANVLDPVLVRRYREGSWLADEETVPAKPVAQRFAEYLMTRSERAESLPENLRTLFSLLGRTGTGAEKESDHSLTELLEPFDKWKVEPTVAEKRTLNGDELRHLGLVLKELDLNDEKHARERQQVGVRVRTTGTTGLQLEIEFQFPVEAKERIEFRRLKRRGARETVPPVLARWNLGRLWVLRQRGLQSPIEPRSDRRVASSGMGLYLANFAAAIVNWELRISRVREAGSAGTCVFLLSREEREDVPGKAP